MSALGHKRTSAHLWIMSALPPKADIAERWEHVRFVPISDVKACLLDHLTECQRSPSPGAPVVCACSNHDLHSLVAEQSETRPRSLVRLGAPHRCAAGRRCATE